MKQEGYHLLQCKENRKFTIRKIRKGLLWTGGVYSSCRFGVLTAVNSVTAVVWDLTTLRVADVYRYYRGKYCFHFFFGIIIRLCLLIDICFIARMNKTSQTLYTHLSSATCFGRLCRYKRSKHVAEDIWVYSVWDVHSGNTWCVQVLMSPKEAFAAAMQSWRERCEKCVCLQGDYNEKWLHFQLPVVSSFLK